MITLSKNIKLTCTCGFSFERPAKYIKQSETNPNVTWAWLLYYCDRCLKKYTEERLFKHRVVQFVKPSELITVQNNPQNLLMSHEFFTCTVPNKKAKEQPLKISGSFIDEVITILSANRLPLENEKQTQERIAELFKAYGLFYAREFHFDKKNIVDFFIDGIAIEVKIKGNARKIYKQCERYCQFENVRALILVTNRSMGFPKELNSKPCYVINIGKSWL